MVCPAAARQLFALGFLTLFLELALIRYLAASVWYLGYFPNLVFLGVFAGMAAGFISHRAIGEALSRRLFLLSPWLLLLLVACLRLFHPAVPGLEPWAGIIGGEVYYATDTDFSPVGTIPALLLWSGALILLFFLVSQKAARLFDSFSPLGAYTLDIAGSCCGILCFMAASLLEVPAWGWFLALAPLFLAAGAGPGKQRPLLAAAIAAAALLVWDQDRRLTINPAAPGTLLTRWSPYQKVECLLTPAPPFPIFVNGLPHQGMDHPEMSGGYRIPYLLREERRLRSYRRVLIIGAGSGNDVSAALLQGAERVDAVEIDPVILGLGRAHHPAAPYQDPRVSVTVGDGRAFLTAARESYDLIVFALTDSLVKVSPLSQLRLENYLFTVEAIERAFALLAADGDLLFYNHYRLPWVEEKLRLGIRAATGRDPEIIYRDNDFAMLRVGPTDAAAPWAQTTERLDPATDDWPFPYLKRRTIPGFYRGAMAALALSVALLVSLACFLPSPAGSRGDTPWRTRLAFVLMGTAFLLLETKSIIQFSLLFGTTWLNNSLVFLAVLVSVLLANGCAALARGPHVTWAASILLVLSCALALWLPVSRLLLIDSLPVRYLAASVFIFAPIFLANLVFSTAFGRQKDAGTLLGWNLAGALLGGVLEYVSMATGYTFLAGLVGALYLGAFVLLAADLRRLHLCQV